MKLYADSPARRVRQLLTDAALVAWTVVWILLARALHEGVLLLARPAQGVSDGSASLADRLRAAGSAVDDQWWFRRLSAWPSQPRPAK